MTNPNSRFITEELGKRATAAENIYYEVPDPDGNEKVWRVRDRVANVVDKILGEQREDRYEVLGKSLDKNRKKGVFRSMFGWAGKKLSRLFKGEPTRVGSTDMPDRNKPDFLRVVSTMQDLIPMSDVIETYDDPDTIETEGLPEDQLAHVARSRALKASLTDLLDKDEVRDPEMAFIYRDLENAETFEDYTYAISALKPPEEEEAAPVVAEDVARLETASTSLDRIGANVSTRLDDQKKAVVTSTVSLVGRTLQGRFNGRFAALRGRYSRFQTSHADATIIAEANRTQIEYDNGNNRIMTPLGFKALYEAQRELDNVEGEIDTKTGDALSVHLHAISNVVTALKETFNQPNPAPEQPKRKLPTIFQIRVLAIARRFARERYALLGTRPEGYDQVIHPDDFKKAYVQAYLDGFGFESEDLRNATLIHAVRQIEEDSAKDAIGLDWILKKSPLKRRARKALHPDMTDEELSRAVADGKILIDEIPGIIALLRASLRSGRVYGRDITLDENFGPLMLKLHKMHRLYTGLNEIEGMDEVSLRSGSDMYLRLVEREAEQARELLRTAARGIVGEPPVAEDEDYEAVANPTEPANEEGGEETSETPATEEGPNLSSKLAERFKSLRENPFLLEIAQFAAGASADWMLARVRRAFTRRRR